MTKEEFAARLDRFVERFRKEEFEAVDGERDESDWWEEFSILVEFQWSTEH